MAFLQDTIIRRYSYDERPSHARNEHHLYLKVSSVDPGSFPIDEKTLLTLCIGPRKNYKTFGYDFHIKEKVDRVWEFTYRNSNKSSIMLGLYTKGFFGNTTEIGEIELNLAAFKANTVTKQQFTLRSRDRNRVPPQIKLSLHLSENGEPSFHAPETNKIEDDFEIIRTSQLGPRSL